MQLLNVLGKKNNIRVLRHLISHKNWEFNISELSKDTGINKGVLSRLIKKLSEENLIKVKKKGKILLFAINKENLVIKELIIPLFEKEKDFFNIIKSELLELKDKNIISIILYGSFASGKAKLTSDIDLLLIFKDKLNLDKINEIKKKFLEMDVLLRIDTMNEKEFRRLYKLKEPLIRSIIKNHKILYGKKIEELI